MGKIRVSHLGKSFKVSKRGSGMGAAVKHFFKREYEEVHALSDVSFEIASGELVGYIGPNGAGKSTTVKIMSGILTPSEGHCEVDGLIPYKDRKKHVKNIGVVFGQRSQLWWDVPVIDSFELLKDIYKISDDDYQQMKNRLIDKLDLGGFINTPVRQLSLGQRMRCELAASLLHNPPVLFLDEPTIGLDAVSKLAVRDFIKSINKEFGTTVILTTHDMDDIEALCSRIIVIGKGRILYDGHMEGLRKMVTTERKLIVDFAQGQIIEGQVPDLPDARLVSFEGKTATFYFDPTVVKASELIKWCASSYEVEDVLVHPVSIEEIIAKLYRVLGI